MEDAPASPAPVAKKARKQSVSRKPKNDSAEEKEQSSSSSSSSNDSGKVQMLDLNAIPGAEHTEDRVQTITQREKRKRLPQQGDEFKQRKAKYSRGPKTNIREITNKKLKRKMARVNKQGEEAAERAAQAEVLLPSSAGFFETEGMQRTFQVSQEDIAEELDVQSSKKIFELNLDQFGPYNMDYSRSGRHLVLGGRKGHIALMDWSRFKLIGEHQVKETVRDIKFLHNQTMYAVAQKKYVYIYDSKGMELHCLKHHRDPFRLEFLPYHFLLSSIGHSGFLVYQDVSTGRLVAQHRTGLGECDVMRQNPYNAVIGLGHHNGVVTFWSPNMTTPLAKVFAHKAPVLALAFDQTGTHMVTSGLDGKVKVWDARMFREMHSYATFRPASSIDISQRGVMALGYGPHVQIWKDGLVQKQKLSYMNVELPGKVIRDVQFCPYEDVLGISHDQGFKSAIIPGSGEPNFDTFEANPYQTMKQRREHDVHALLDKISPELISLNPNIPGTVDRAPKEVLAAELKAAQEANKEAPKEKNRMKGRNKSSKRFKRKQANIIDQKAVQEKEQREKQEAAEKKKREEKERQAEGKAKSALDRFM